MNKIVLCLLVVIFFPSLTWAKQSFEVYGEGRIYSVVDGDTLWVSGINQEIYDFLWKKSGDKDHFIPKYNSVKMRIGGIDTSESNHFDKRLNTDKGKKSKYYLKNLVEKDKAKFVCWDIGYHNRPICMVNASTIGDIGLHMIRNGHTKYNQDFGDHPYLHDHYKKY